MTKSQMLARIAQTAKLSKTAAEMAGNVVDKMNDDDGAALGIAILTVSTNITDALNNIALILCETLPKEE